MYFITFLYRLLPLLLQGLFITVQLWVMGSIIGLTFGTLFGIITSNMLRIPGLFHAITAYVVIVRGIPLYVHVLITYFVLPDLLGLNFSAFTAAIITLGIVSTAYTTEIVRAGTNAIPIGQWQAAYVLGYTTIQTLWYIIIPQMLRTIFPALINELDSLIKGTSILSTIGVLELTRMGMNIIAREMNPGTVYLTIAALYLLTSTILNIVARFVERRLNHD